MAKFIPNPNSFIKDNSLEYKIFLFITNIGILLTTILIILDVVLTRSIISILLDAIGMISLVVFGYFGRINANYKKFALILCFEILALVTFGWVVGNQASATSNWPLISLTASASIAMLNTKERNIFLIVLFVMLFGIGTFDYLYAVEHLYHLRATPLVNLFNFTYGCIILYTEIIIVCFIKNKYNSERALSEKQVHLLNNAAKELELQTKELESRNQELSQQNEEITAQRDIIEKAREKLASQSIELGQALKKIEDYSTKLEQMVEERTEEIMQLNKELDLFMYRSSHDIRGPLMTLKGLTHIGRLLKRQEDHATIWDKVDLTVENVDRMLRKFVMISEISHYEQFEAENLLSIINNLRGKYHSQVHNIQVNTHILLSNYPQVDKRNKLLFIILENLLENSVQFRNRAIPAIVSLDIWEDNGMVHVSITDNGIGIDPVLMSKVSTMYFRGNEESIGNGLGLYVVKQAVKKLSGTWEIKSTLHTSTTIHIQFRG